jgi:heptosyltransferase-2
MRILIMRFSSLGDVVLATAALNYIKAQRPEAELVFLTKAAYAPLLEGHPALKEVWTLQGSALAMAGRIRQAGFDAILDLQGKPRSFFLGAWSGSRVERMKNHAWNRRLRVWFPGGSRTLPPHVADRAVQAAAGLLGEPFTAAAPSLVVSPAASAWADDFLWSSGLREGETVLAIAPGAAWPTKRWNSGSFAQALGLVAEQGRRFLFVGDAADEALARRIIGYARKGADRCIVAAGKTDFPALAALLKRSELLLSNDSGPMHVAGAVGTPVVALFGPTVEAFGFFPRGSRDRVLQRDLACRPCSVHGGDRCPLGTHACMEGIAPFEVAQAVEGVLRS